MKAGKSIAARIPQFGEQAAVEVEHTRAHEVVLGLAGEEGDLVVVAVARDAGTDLGGMIRQLKPPARVGAVDRVGRRPLREVEVSQLRRATDIQRVYRELEAAPSEGFEAEPTDETTALKDKLIWEFTQGSQT